MLRSHYDQRFLTNIFPSQAWQDVSQNKPILSGTEFECMYLDTMKTDPFALLCPPLFTEHATKIKVESQFTITKLEAAQLCMLLWYLIPAIIHIWQSDCFLTSYQ